MKSVVITGSARGLGFEMAKVFRENNYNVVISDLNEKDLIAAKDELLKIKSDAKILYYVCNVSNRDHLVNVIKKTSKELGSIDIWINNAGINQPDKLIWELSEDEVSNLIDIDLKGTIIASSLVINEMIKQGTGAVYNVEGHGSNDAVIKGLSIYGTTKRAITYFTNALAKECEIDNNGIIVGKLSPGIMITDFIVNALRDQKIVLSEKTKKVYNILGDYPDVVARFLVNGMINNTKNGIRIEWLTNRKASWRFMTSPFSKRSFFESSSNSD